ncbi:MAG: hypothetical protein HWE39_15680 [Oceanospirillaceae bacterium]|nr:hypothetical protein [Oceanospirillaceae bacterium]
MKSENVKWLDRFVRQSLAWRWPAFLKRLHAKDVLVIDADILRMFENRLETLPCQTVSPKMAESRIDGDFNRVFVLCRKDELRLVERLRAKFPRKRIYSMTYDVAPRSLFAPPVKFPQPVMDATPAKRPIILISSPYSDAEFLANILSENGLGAPKEYLDQPLATWIEQHEGFQLARYFDALVKLYRKDGVFDLHLQTDVLAAILRRSNGNWHSFAKWLKQTDAQVIYFTRRDKMAQTGFGAVLDNSKYRSIWEMSPALRKAFKGKEINFAEANAWLQNVLIQEGEVENFLQAAEIEFRSVTLEELIETPVAVLKSLTMFLGEKAPKAFMMPDYASAYAELPELWDQARNFRREMIDRLGLHVNAEGSYVTATDEILKGRKA